MNIKFHFEIFRFELKEPVNEISVNANPRKHIKDPMSCNSSHELTHESSLSESLSSLSSPTPPIVDPLNQEPDPCITEPENLQYIKQDSNMDLDKYTISWNPIGELQELCQKNQWPTPSYIFVSREGPPHMPSFKFQVMIRCRDSTKAFEPNSSYPTKKKAKSEAAKFALIELRK